MLIAGYTLLLVFLEAEFVLELVLEFDLDPPLGIIFYYNFLLFS